MYQVLARKYRPKIFDEIAGQDNIVQTLKNAVIHDRIAHAYIFSGTRGVGKTSIARILAKSINCENGPTINPCGVCSACIQIQNGSSVDVIEIDGASNTGVDAIRDLKENIIYLPQSFKYKIYIIDEVHMLSNSAFNALLKTLEEPPAHAKFIFATTELHKVPETILSRCQRFNFKRIPTDIIYRKLKEIAAAEDISVTDENLMIMASLADGSVRDSLTTFDTIISYFGKDIKEDISPVLGLTVKAAIVDLTYAIFKKDYEASIGLAKELYDSGADIRQFIKQLAFYIRNILIIKLKYKDMINDMTDEEINALIPLAGQKHSEELLDMIDILLNSDAKYQKISSPSLMLELTLFRLINIPPKHNVTELINKIDKFISLKTNPAENSKMEDKTGKFNLNDAAALTPPPPAFDSSFALRQPLPKTAAPAPAQTDRQVKIAPNGGNNTHGGSDEFFAHFDKIDEKLAQENGKQETNALLIDDGIKANEAEKPDESIIMESIKDIFGKDIERIDKTKK